MARLTSDPSDPDIERGVDTEERSQSKAYLILSDEERAKGFVRPVRTSYVHVGILGPRYPTHQLTEKEIERLGSVAYEPYPEDVIKELGVGRYWAQEELDKVGKGCGGFTKMSRELAETYAREPGFYGATYCVSCSMHLPVGRDGEFVWDGTDERVGT